MNKKTLLCGLLFCMLMVLPRSYAQEIVADFIIADFDSGEKPNNIGGDFGTWDYDPNDETQFCLMEFSEIDSQPEGDGKSVKLTYDVQSTKPAFNGFWMKLRGVDVSPYNRLRFWVKGDGSATFTSRFKIELKNNLGKRAIYFVKDVTTKWKEYVIDFKQTRAIQDWTQMNEFTVVFSDIVSTYKEGAIYIDNISFLTVKEEVVEE
ncbi:MAG: hypothetical protein KKH94_01525 [Candidatus Omnitrophica bacterium]|nr:hypothetical protein [Candidatus Omnitrophota bacterium]